MLTTADRPVKVCLTFIFIIGSNMRTFRDLETEIKIWHEQTFPDTSLSEQLLKLEEELQEWDDAVNTENELKEAADIFIVCCGLKRWNSYVGSFVRDNLIDYYVSSYDLLKCYIITKFDKNKKRVWQKQSNGTYHHINNKDLN